MNQQPIQVLSEILIGPQLELLGLSVMLCTVLYGILRQLTRIADAMERKAAQKGEEGK